MYKNIKPVDNRHAHDRAYIRWMGDDALEVKALKVRFANLPESSIIGGLIRIALRRVQEDNSRLVEALFGGDSGCA